MVKQRNGTKRIITIEPPRQLIRHKDGSFEIPAWRLEELAAESACKDALLDAVKIRTLDHNEAPTDIIEAHAL